MQQQINIINKHEIAVKHQINTIIKHNIAVKSRMKLVGHMVRMEDKRLPKIYQRLRNRRLQKTRKTTAIECMKRELRKAKETEKTERKGQ